MVGVSVGCAAAAGIAQSRPATIEPRTRANGMLVVQGSSRQSQASLFGAICDPVVLKPGRRTRTCAPVGRVSRLFVGYGLFAPLGQIEREWKAVGWKLWLDGQPVDLDAFGTSDRVLSKYPPADFKDVVLREWSIVLVDPTPGRHTIRYRAGGREGATDTSWVFRVRSS